MKKILLNISAVAIVLFATACTKGFDEMNKDPNKVEEIDPGYLLTKVWMKYNGSPHEEQRGNLIMAGPLSGITQCAYRNGQGFDGNNDGYSEAKMSEMYRETIKNASRLITVLREDQTQDNTAKLAIASITLQFQFQRITDLYGDIPYFEAGKGFETQNFYPKYDSQELIYKSMVDTLKKYRDVLLSTDAKPFSTTGDVFYGSLSEGGRKAAWARTANSLIMRLGMRAVAADESWAKETVVEAANNTAGYIESINIGDGFILQTSMAGGDWGGHMNGANSAAHSGPYTLVGDEWLRMAQENRDPRIFYTTCQSINNNGDWQAWTGQTDFDAFAEANRVGEPWKPVTFLPARAGGTESFSVRGMMTVDGNRLFADWNVDLNKTTAEYAQYHTLANINPETIGNREAPIVVFGGDESYYILAEAAKRGWAVPGDVNSNLESALNLSFDKYPTLFNFGNSPAVYMNKQSKKEGKEITYDNLKSEYIRGVLAENANLELIWRERWKSMMSTFTYEAFSLWNRTNLAVTPQGISFPGTQNMNIPQYAASDVENPVLGKEIATSKYKSEPFHNGGDTQGNRPRRLNYPNDERTNNGKNLADAMNHQIQEYGKVGGADHFVVTRMWISKK